MGLGNVGKEYDNTRHNAGFFLLDMLAEHYDFPAFAHEVKLKALLSGKIIEDTLYLLVKPTTFMNKSGETLTALCKYYDCSPEDVYVIYDDIDLPLGDMRYRETGSAGTHNGMKSILACAGTKDIKRVRVGIGPDHPIKDLSAFVLGAMSRDELASMEQAGERLRIKGGKVVVENL